MGVFSIGKSMEMVPDDKEQIALRDCAPTPDELEKYPALKHAWEEYMVIRKLTIPDPEKPQKTHITGWSGN